MRATSPATNSGFVPSLPLLKGQEATSKRGCVKWRASATSSQRNVVVVGAGIMGLTTAIRLAEASHAVTVIAKESPSTILSPPPGETPSQSSRGTYTSSGSGGFWMPVFLEGDEIQGWARKTYHDLCAEPENVGVRMHDGFLLSAKEEPQLTWYSDFSSMSISSPSEDSRIPSRYCGALKFRTPIVTMDEYLPYLERRLASLDIPIILTSSLPGDDVWDLTRARDFAQEAYGDGTVVVNCAGIGAGHLSEEVMVPGRGVTARIERPKHKNYFITESADDGFLSKNGLLAYALPRGEEYTLGGTLFKGDWREEADEEETTGVIERALDILGMERSDVQLTRTWTGLRPMTTDGRARVGVQKGAQGDVIANFGHGGSGVTLCWGCADEVVRMVQSQ